MLGTQTLVVADGRRLCYEVAGDPAGTPVLVHNGTPNSRHLYGPWAVDAASKGLCLIGYDRPGYGASSPLPDHSVASGVEDVRAIADHMGFDRFATWGVSGGGPFALACAALLPDRVMAAAAVASVAPYGQEGLAFYEGMGESNAESFRLFVSDRQAARRKTHENWLLYTSVPPEQVTRDLLAEVMASLLCPADREALTEEFTRWFVTSLYDGLAPGDQGWWDDTFAHMTDWGFDLSSIRVPVKVWHGQQDHFVPIQHGEWLAATIPGAEVEILGDDGHLSLIARIGPVHDWLLEYLT